MRRQNNINRDENMAFGAPAHGPAAPPEGRVRGLVVGLRILEYIAACRTPVTRSAIAAALNLKISTVLRLMIVLEQRGFVAPAAEDGSYTPTQKLHQFQSTARPYQQFLGHARSVMRSLSDSISQSCNLAIPSSHDMQVVAQAEAPGPCGINVPIGFRYDVPASAPGLAFAAFMRNSDPAHWPQGLSSVVDADDWTFLKQAIQHTTEAGFAKVANQHLPDIIDLSCPIFDRTQFVAALTIPYIKTRTGPSLTWCLATLQQAAEQLNQTLQRDKLVA